MKRTGRKKEWSITLFCLALLAFFPPLLSLFDHPVLIFGFPLLYLYLFGFWGAIIIAVAIAAIKRSPYNPQGDYQNDNLDTSEPEAGELFRW